MRQVKANEIVNYLLGKEGVKGKITKERILEIIRKKVELYKGCLLN